MAEEQQRRRQREEAKRQQRLAKAKLQKQEKLKHLQALATIY